MNADILTSYGVECQRFLSMGCVWRRFFGMLAIIVVYCPMNGENMHMGFWQIAIYLKDGLCIPIFNLF